MIVPFGKLEMINCIDLGVDIFYFFKKDGLKPYGHLILLICLLGVYLINFKKNYYVIIGFLLTYVWLIYKIDYKEITNSIPVSVSVLVYLLVTSYTSYRIIVDSRFDNNSN